MEDTSLKYQPFWRIMCGFLTKLSINSSKKKKKTFLDIYSRAIQTEAFRILSMSMYNSFT